MRIAKALKLKNQLAGEVAQLKDLLNKQNVRSSKQKFDYDNREVLARLRGKLPQTTLSCHQPRMRNVTPAWSPGGWRDTMAMQSALCTSALRFSL